MADSDIPGGGTAVGPQAPHLNEFAHGAYSARGEEDMEHFRDGAPLDTVDCPACGGDAQHLGNLGRVKHYRCRNCGLDSHTSV